MKPMNGVGLDLWGQLELHGAQEKGLGRKYTELGVGIGICGAISFGCQCWNFLGGRSAEDNGILSDQDQGIHWTGHCFGQS